MRFNVLVTGALYSSQSGYSALQFCQSAVAAGHAISQVFFYQDGVQQANSLSMPLSDEFEPVSAWASFSQEHGVDLVVCVSAAERRGVMSDEQAKEFAKGHGDLHSAFSIAGLGALHEASLDSDRTVTFK
jgi:tRNA 2-thiouridine synthesizing protein D